MHFEMTPWGPEAFLHINDPMSYYTQPVAFSVLSRVWIDALVVN